jgi:hypothetical protein
VRQVSGARRFEPRAEFRRANREAEWVLAGIWLSDVFYPAAPGVEPVRRRMPPGVLGWVQLDTVIAQSAEEAARRSLELAASRWPRSNRSSVPYP